MQRLQKGPDLTPTPLFNPSLEAFTLSFDHVDYLLPAYGIETFPKWVADRIASQLADTIIGKLGVRENRQLDKEKLLLEIYVK